MKLHFYSYPSLHVRVLLPIAHLRPGFRRRDETLEGVLSSHDSCITESPSRSILRPMRAQAIEVAWHNESSVWSVDCARNEPDLRFVTAGNDKTARVWRLLDSVHDLITPVTKRSKGRLPDKSSTGKPDAGDRATAETPSSAMVPVKLPVEWLCDLNGHSATVNVARFSPTSAMIASGADGGELIVWAQALGSDGDGMRCPNRAKERWSQSCIIRGHSADILDLSWSSDGKRLASASVDNTFRVWDVSSPKRPLAVISCHDSMVQGVAFDPVDRFIASLGNDRALAVHLASGFKSNGLCSTSVDEPKTPYFASDMESNVLFRRLAWSPDGSFLACPSGLQVPSTSKAHLYAVHLFARGNWKAPVLQCGGLTKLPIAVAFCPKLFALRRDPPEAPFFDLPYRIVFAVACLDSVLIYDTESFGRPIGRVSRVHYAELTDLTWAPDGASLLVSSCDGSVSVIALSKEEIGDPLPSEKQPAWIQEKQRKSIIPSAIPSAGVGPTPLATKLASVSEPFTPVTVVPRRKSDAHGPPPASKYPTIQGPGTREVTVIVPHRELLVDVEQTRRCPADDPARKRLKLE